MKTRAPLAVYAALALASYAHGLGAELNVYSEATFEKPITTSVEPPAELRAFWGGIKREWGGGQWWIGGTIAEYCRQYAKNNPDALQRIMKDDRCSTSEVKDMIYSFVVTQLDQEKTMPSLQFYAARGTAVQQVMANDFIADIEEINRDQAFPTGDDVPANRLPVTDAPSALQKFWKGIDRAWIDNWSKTELLSSYCSGYAHVHRNERLVPSIMDDLLAHPSEMRDLVYSRLVEEMDPKEARRILIPYATHGSIQEKTVAEDLLLATEYMPPIKSKLELKSH